MVEFLVFGMLATAIAAVILLLFTLIASRLFTRPAPSLREISHLMIGEILIPNPSFVILGFWSCITFLDIFAMPIFGPSSQIKGLRLDLALPALFFAWVILKLAERGEDASS
jgi:hypothetical protein